MPKWITTYSKTIRFNFDYTDESNKSFFASKHSSNVEIFQTPYAQLQSHLANFTAWADANQLTIKSVMPLTTAISQWNAVYWKGNGGYGYGYGVSPITGMVILLQKEEEISEEEYEYRVYRQQLITDIEELQPQIHALEQVVHAEAKLSTTVTEKRKILGGTYYLLNEQEFTTEKEATAALQALRERVNQNQQNLLDLKEELEDLTQELATLDEPESDEGETL